MLCGIAKNVSGEMYWSVCCATCFSYPTEQSVHQAVEELISFCKQKDPLLTIRKTKNELSIHAAEGVDAYLKTAYHAATRQQRLFFCAVPSFFEYE